VRGAGPVALTDADLLRACAAGDHDAFGAFVERHEASVHRYVRALTDDADRVDDALQETFIAAWRGAAGFRGGAGARAWLLRIARHASHRQYRRHAGQPQHHVSLDELAQEAGWGSGSADAITARLAAREVLEAGFAALDAEDREILVLRDLEGLTGDEAAETLGISLAAQKSRLHRARLRFLATVKGIPA
jgi:RNA polymerase sigma-70 factor, ECF subfamily